ncbi:hypothetical protein K8Q98_01205 [Candidatus Nomurabacteria bacterium]|nr:hypothetical protein [Candidatus Nomurabacteria bacterium]
MRFEKGVSKAPIGKGAELKATRETLPSVEVKNKVIWVNPSLDAPFNLKVGEPTRLGTFLSAKIPGDKLNLEVKNYHGRSAMLGRVVFKEKTTNTNNPQIYRDIDLKGIGHVVLTGWIGPVQKRAKGEAGGILNKGAALQDMGISEIFHEYGIRTHRVIAIIELEEIVSEDKKVSIADAKKLGMISEGSLPVVEVRAFGTQARLMDAVNQSVSSEKRNILIEDARLLVAEELGLDIEKFSRDDYAKWLVRTVGKNLGLMHQHGYVHKYLSMGHNITLDGCLVDFDSVGKLRGSPADAYYFGYEDDYTDASSALAAFLKDAMGYDNETATSIMDEYRSAYSDYKK